MARVYLQPGAQVIGYAIGIRVQGPFKAEVFDFNWGGAGDLHYLDANNNQHNVHIDSDGRFYYELQCADH